MKINTLLKGILAFLIYLSITPTFSYGQLSSTHDHRTCGADAHLKERLKDPNFASKYYSERAAILVSAQQKSVVACTNPVIVPVVVHYESGSISNQCMIDAAIAQIDQMNLDFRSCNANAADLCSWIDAGCTNFGGTAGADAMPEDGVCIQFCLADQNHPSGETVIGGYAITAGDYSSNSQNASNAWQGYFNVYVGAAGGNLGFVPFLGGASNANNTQGASVLTSTFGAAGFSGCEGVGTDNTFSNGATLTHEAGHWFGVEHTFSDNLADTPPQNNPNFGCPTVDTNTCTSGVGTDYSANFMDYVDDDCMSNFSADQVAIMQSTAAAQNQWNTNSISCYTGWQNGSITYSSCVTGPCGNPVAPTADFSPDSGTESTCNASAVINFTDLSSGVPTSWAWTFSGAGVSPTSSTSQNPTVTASASGNLVATLTVTNAVGTDTHSGTIVVDILPPSDPFCQTMPCLDFAGGPYTNFNYADACAQVGCNTVTTTFEVWENEAYTLAGLIGGLNYTFEFCTAYNANTWDAVITIGEYDSTTNAAVPNSQIAVANGCTISFTAPADGDYIAVVSGNNNCGGAENQTDNGEPTFTCNTQCVSQCGLLFTDSGGVDFNYRNDESKTYVLCPDNPGCEVIEVDFTLFDLRGNIDALAAFDGNSTAGTSLGVWIGNSGPTTLTSTDASGCLTFTFTSNANGNDPGWEANVFCVDTGACACPNDYAGANALSGSETGTGGQNGNGDYETDGPIESTQVINSGNVDYDSADCIELNNGFEVVAGAEVDIFIDGCNDGAGGNTLRGEQTTTNQRKNVQSSTPQTKREKVARRVPQE